MIKMNTKEAENWLLVKEYSWLVKADDKFLSNWEGVTKRHLTIVACKTAKQSVDVQKSMRKDVTFSNIERIVLCGWADDGNKQPFLDAFAKWIEYLKSSH